MTEKVSYKDDFMKWQTLHTAALSNIITAIKQLQRIGFDDGEIIKTVQQEINRQARVIEYKEIREGETKNK